MTEGVMDLQWGGRTIWLRIGRVGVSYVAVFGRVGVSRFPRRLTVAFGLGVGEVTYAT